MLNQAPGCEQPLTKLLTRQSDADDCPQSERRQELFVKLYYNMAQTCSHIARQNKQKQANVYV